MHRLMDALSNNPQPNGLSLLSFITVNQKQDVREKLVKILFAANDSRSFHIAHSKLAHKCLRLFFVY
jgi:hypothetical protein